MMKKFVKNFGPVNSKKSVEKDVAFRKKKKSGVLKNGATSELVLSEKAVGSSWKSEAGNTTKSDSIDMKEKCLIEETSVDYGEKSLFIEDNSNQTPKSLKLVTKKALNTPLGKINFLDDISNDNILLDTPVIFSPPLKNLVNVSVRKSFVMDIELDKEKLVVVRKLFSKVNDFGKVFTSSKFLEIIHAFFNFESSLAQATEKARAANILVNTNLKRSPNCSDQAYDKSKPFLLNYKATIGCNITMMKKFVKNFGPVNSKKSVEKDVAFRKKKKSGVLKNGATSELVLSEKAVGSSWKSEAGNTTKSDSIDMKEKCLIEETSVDYGEKSLFIEDNSNQTPKSLKLVTKKALNTPLGKINFLDDISNDNILLDTPVIFSPPLKNLVNVSVRKSFVMDIELDKEKLVVVRKLFSKVNDFGKVFTSSKFLEIIHAFFNFESSLAQATEKARAANILVNTNLKRSPNCSDQAVIIKKIPVGTSAKTVCIVFSEFGSVVLIKMQLIELWQKTVIKFAQSNQANLVESWNIKNQYRALLYTLLISTNAHDIWDFIGSVDDNKSRLASIYAKCSAPISCLVSFGGASWTNVVDRFLFSLLPIYNDSAASGFSLKVKPTLMMFTELNDRFATFEHSLVSLIKCINKLAKRLDLSGPMVSQPSSGCQSLIWFENLQHAIFMVSMFLPSRKMLFIGMWNLESKMLVVILGLYVGASAETRHSLVKVSTWGNLQNAKEIINYIFVSESLSSAVAGHKIVSVSDFFDTDYNAVLVLVGLEGLLNAQLNSVYMQTNKNKWKFKIKNVNADK
ncbi:hypothetical protein G9A89_012301 [Geosiphon pyriformis]|nr:hypothetical protein G9A89_012301 [Geosiphon pyriformis]